MTVEDAIADVAMMFHWQPSSFEAMDLDELMQWREQARKRAETQQDE